MECSITKISTALTSHAISGVFFGASGISVADESTLARLQIGFSIHPDGSGLTGTEDGSWYQSWIVIATDSVLGDPFFVDTSDPPMPVYTAMHGEGQWIPEQVSTSLNSFLESLLYLNKLSKQSFAQVSPDENTITDPRELAVIERQLQTISGETEYWEYFMEQHCEWVEDHE
ncbi:hypothetical protein [Pseudoalteromonas rubra]|uniref:SMI1/KNR4 family protein n=1 Tax=Pseudoalteromonas rubra TaxID=43658 RepID=A0A5S3WY76_9GAMM|nr:hypothetical protein [Pseudoalteromonas rubra]TMP35974.1 hypothetical protein CWB98_14580 [Pseudoalteromonas rubra]